MEADLGDRETRMWLETADAGELELSLVELAVAATCFSEVIRLNVCTQWAASCLDVPTAHNHPV